MPAAAAAVVSVSTVPVSAGPVPAVPVPAVPVSAVRVSAVRVSAVATLLAVPGARAARSVRSALAVTGVVFVPG